MLNDQILNERFFKDFLETVEIIYKYNWAERNGGNISYIIDEKIIEKHTMNSKSTFGNSISLQCSKLNNKFLLVTGSGKFYRNIINPEKIKDNCGIIKITNDGKSYEVVWGFENNSKPTSELPSHLQSHSTRMNIDSKHKIVIHSHLTHLIALSFLVPLDEKELTHKLWEMISECSVVFPEGLGIVPWMLPGSNEVGMATAEKMKTYKNVIWPHHGIFASGDTFDNVLGCLEIIDKASYIYLNILQAKCEIKQTITNSNLKEMEKGFNIKLKSEFLK